MIGAAAIIMNGLALVLGVLFAVLLYNWKSKTVGKMSGWIWAGAVFAGIMVFFNAIIGISNDLDEKRMKEAFAILDQQMIEAGNPNEESWDNVRLTIKTASVKRTIDHHVYVGNFNHEKTFKGKVYVALYKDHKMIAEDTSLEFTLNPGEKKEINIFSGPSSYDSYRWEWIGELQ